MRTQAHNETDPLTFREAKAWEEWTRFDVCGVFHFNHFAEGRRGSSEVYKKVAQDFITSASKRIFGKSGFRRRPAGHRLIPSQMTIEMVDDLPHLNVLFRLPEGYDLPTFRERIIETWLRSPWAATGSGAVCFEPRESASTRLVGYINKEQAGISIDEMLTV